MKTEIKLLQISLLITLLSACNSGGNSAQHQSTLANSAHVSDIESTPVLPAASLRTTTPVVYSELDFKKMIWQPLVAADKADPGGDIVPAGGDVVRPYTPSTIISSVTDGFPEELGSITSIASWTTSTGIPFYGATSRYPEGTCSEWIDYDFRADDATVPSFAIANNDVKFNETMIYAGETILTNKFDEAKPMSSSEFTKTISVSNSTATTTGWKIGTGTKVSGEISIGVGKIGAEVSVTTEYNSSTTDQVTKTTTDTYTASPQKFTVPAHSSARITAYLSLGSAAGTYTTYTPLNPDGKINWAMTSTCGDQRNVRVDSLDLRQAYKLAPQAFESFPSFVESNEQIYLTGTGSYSVQNASRFYLTIEPIPTPNNDVPQAGLLSTGKKNIATYTVPAIATKH